MTLANVRALRITLGTTLAIAVAYGVAWPLSFMMPLFAVMFLAMPGPWFGWKMALQIIRRLLTGLLCGLIISEFFLGMPFVCVPLYALLFFYIFYNDATAPPMATIFMTLGITMVPILGLQGTMASHFIVGCLFVNMSLGFVFTWQCIYGFPTVLPRSTRMLPRPSAPHRRLFPRARSGPAWPWSARWSRLPQFSSFSHSTWPSMRWP